MLLRLRTPARHASIGLAILAGCVASLVGASPSDAITTTATVNVGEYPTAIAVNDVTNKAYVANTRSGTISEIDGSSLARRDIVVGTWPRAVAVYRPQNLVFVANYLSDTVSVITPSPSPKSTLLPVPGGPVNLAVNEITKKLFVTSYIQSALTVIDIPSLTVETVIPFPFEGAWAVAVNKVTNKVVVSFQTSSNLRVIDGASFAVEASFGSGGDWPYDIAIDEAANRAFVVNNLRNPVPAQADSIAVIDLTSLSSASENFDPSGTLVYLLRSVDVDPVTGKAYAVGYLSSDLFEIDASAFPTLSTERIPIGATHTAAIVHSGARRLYMPNAAAETVDQMSLVDRHIVRSWVGNDPFAAALDYGRNTLYVANSASNNVSVVVGDCGPGLPGSSKTAFLAEGSTINFDEWVVLANPVGTQTSACLTYFTPGGFAGGRWVTIGPNRRISLRVNDNVVDHEVSTRIDSGPAPVSAERAMYSRVPGLVGAHLGKETTAPANSWLLPEGVSAEGTETWVLVANPSPSLTATVSVTFLTGSGPVALAPVALPPMTRRTFRVGAYVPPTFDVSTEVSSSGAAVIAERATYLAHGGYAGSTESPGISAPATTWYVGEGATAGGFDTWILLANPSPTSTANAVLTFATSTGPRIGPSVAIPPKSRRTVKVDDYVTDFDVATKVTSDLPIAVERAIYLDDPVRGKASASGEAVTTLKTSWLLVEGATAGGFETWTLVSNPSSSTQTIRIVYLTEAGQLAPAALQSISLSPGQRRSFRANDYVPGSYTVSARVEVVGAGPGVVAEHTIFAPPSLAPDMTSGPGL